LRPSISSQTGIATEISAWPRNCFDLPEKIAFAVTSR
jgi:hypothetical protein